MFDVGYIVSYKHQLSITDCADSHISTVGPSQKCVYTLACRLKQIKVILPCSITQFFPSYESPEGSCEIRNSRYEIRDTKCEIRDTASLANHVHAHYDVPKQKMANAAEETLRVCGSSGVVFVFIVGPEGNFRMEELGKWQTFRHYTFWYN